MTDTCRAVPQSQGIHTLALLEIHQGKELVLSLLAGFKASSKPDKGQELQHPAHRGESSLPLLPSKLNRNSSYCFTLRKDAD